MLAVVDTNVWVSAFLTPGGTPGKLLSAVKRQQLVLAYSEEIETEYRHVLRRPHFHFEKELVSEFLHRLQEEGQRISDPVSITQNLPDPSDAPSIAVAKTAACPVVTGNTKHFPAKLGVQVLSPAQCLQMLSTV
ncbi:MAG: putative toxin-antitoxin system toxin component, PIN family [Betaproteobacteria bacterium]